MAYHRKIDNRMLIKEVKARPALYDKSVPQYNDIKHKYGLWKEVTKQVLYRDFETMNQGQKDKAVFEIQQRWKNLRACFRRELRIQKSSKSQKRTYIYFHKLLFLLPDQESITYQEGKESYPESNEEEDEEVEMAKEDYDEIQPDTDTIDNSDVPNKKLNSSELYEFTDEIEDNRQNIDSEKSFALSLVPMLKAVPFKDKMDCYISILSVLKKYVRTSESKNYTIFMKSEDASYDSE